MFRRTIDSMQTSIAQSRLAASPTAVGAIRRVHTFFGLLLCLCFAAVAVVALVVPELIVNPITVGVIASGGIVVGIMLASIAWSRIAPLWLDIFLVGLTALITALISYSGAGTSPFAVLFFVVTACAVTTARRTSGWALTALIAVLQLSPLFYSPTEPELAIRTLFSPSVHLAIAMVAYVAGLRYAASAQDADKHVESGSLPSTRDRLTGLYTRAALAQQLHDIQSSTAATETFSMVLIGVERWQELCEKHGQRSGDDIIRQIAVLLQNHSRSSDIPARYDENTFLIIFPGTSAEIAMKLGDRLRIVIEQHRFWTPHSTTRLRIHLNMGVSAYPEDGANPEDLARRATQRMLMLQQAHKAPAGAIE